MRHFWYLGPAFAKISEVGAGSVLTVIHHPSNMVLSYSAIAQPKADTPKIINISGQQSITQPPTQTQNDTSAPAHISHIAPQPEAGPSTQPRIKHLILDAGPLLSLTPLRHLASHFYTTPAVLQELRDPKAREYYQNLGLSGVDVQVVQPGGEAMARGKLSVLLG